MAAESPKPKPLARLQSDTDSSRGPSPQPTHFSVPLANHDDNQHAPDENLRLGHFVQGIRTMITVMHGLAQG